ncbi:LuxR C-terminal-related transcriptional regulator [Psychrobacter sp. I-STPA10]|uniref:LuxR C-terminal-related transcriptional regulator n=1 Tax=Psychrobacter sp. I-STPA10 TaxID=2585769 RepID=UPI001E56FF9C|nr:LuxR C-terminal-related transcriptional regulator [Psychrobacter sp. I-STPA10]
MVYTTGAKNIRLPLMLTKLEAPTNFGHLLQRQRLMDKLIRGIDYRVMLIRGPAGFGKTSLALQWRDYLIKQDYHVAWLSLDSEDNDPERCIQYIVEAIHNIEASIEVNTAPLSQSTSPPSLQAIKFILTDLINQLQRLDKRVYLFFDDWHFIDSPIIHDALNFLIECASENFHMVICSRTQPAIPIYTLQVKHQLYVIDSIDLRFDESETAHFLSEIEQIDLHHEVIHKLWLKTEGWIASLQLIVLLLRTTKEEQNFVNLFDDFEKIHSIDEYLAENVLNSLPEDTLDFLLQTSILARLNNELCNTVTGRQDSQALLEFLYKQGIFIRPLDQEQSWFQYHPLFADFLQRRLQQHMPDKLSSLHLAAAQWFANIEQTDEAVNHAIAAQEIEQAIVWVEKDAMWLVEHSFMSTLLQLVDKLPAKEIQMRCELQLAIAWAYCLTHQQQQAQQALDFVEQALTQKNHSNAKNIHIEARVLQACIDMYADRLDKVAQLLPDYFSEEDIANPWVIVVANNIITYVLIHTYRYVEAIDLQQRVTHFHQQTQGPFSNVYGDCFAGIAYIEQCQLDNAEKSLKRAQEKAWEEAGRHSHAAYLSNTLLGQLYYERNQIDAAEILLTQSRTLGVEGGVVDFYMATYCFSSRIEILKNNFSEAHVILAEGRQIAQKLHIPRLDFLLRAELIKLYLLEDNLKLAEQMMQQWQKLTIPTDKSCLVEQMLDMRASAEARLLCRTGQQVQAIELLTKVLNNHINRQRYYCEIGTRTLLAMVMNKAGRYSEAEEMLLPALKRGFEQGILRTFLDEDQNIIKIVARLAKRCRQDKTDDTSAEFNRWLVSILALDKTQIEQVTMNTSNISNSSANRLIIQSFTQKNEIFIEPLKEKEMHILKMLEKGLTNKKIARNLNVSVDTVKWYLKAIYSKLGVSRRAQAVIEAKKLKLLD